MRQVSPELTAAIESPERVLTQDRLMVDWDGDGYGPAGSSDDLSRHVAATSSDGVVSGDLPDAVRVVSGNAARSLDVDLAGGSLTDDTIGAVSYFSPTAAAGTTGVPLAGKRRRGLACYHEVGFVTDNGLEYVRTFTGRTTNLPIGTGQRSAQLQAVDNRIRLRTQVTLPAMVAEIPELAQFLQSYIAPAMEATWLVSYVAAANGLYASPPPRSDCRVWAPMHGSGQAFIHDAIEGLASAWDEQAGNGGSDPSLMRACQFGPGPYLLALTTEAGRDARVTGTAAPGGTPLYDGQGRSIGRAEVWVRIPSGGSAGDDVVSVSVDGTRATLTVHGDGSGQVQVGDDPPTTWAAGLVPADTWCMVGLTWDETIGQGFYRLNGNSTFFTFSQPAAIEGALPGENWGWSADIAEGAALAELHITAGIDTLAPWLDESAFTAGVIIDRSVNTLDGIVPTGNPYDPWDLLKQVAEAERAVVYFDGDGLLRYRTRTAVTSAAGQTDQVTVTSLRKVSDLRLDVDVSRVANVISCPYTVISYSDANPAWEPSDTLMLPAHRRTDIHLEFTGPVIGSTIGLRASWNSKDDGTGTDWGTGSSVPDRDVLIGCVHMTLTVLSATTAILTLRNYSALPVYAVDATGQQDLAVLATTLSTATGGVTPTVRDDTSISGDGTWDGYGEIPLALPDNPWRQCRCRALSVSQAILADTADPAPAITALEIVGDPRLEYLDRIRVQDTDGARLDGSYWVRGITARRSGSSYTMTLVAVQARDIALFDAGRFDMEVFSA